MATWYHLFIFIFSLSPTFSTVVFSEKQSIDWWCNTTPHPNTCMHYFTNHRYRHLSPKLRTSFRKFMVKMAMDQILHAKKQAKKIRANCGNKRQRYAWTDCLRLYDSTIFQLRRILKGFNRNNQSCSDFDTQTWLSTSLTNIQTCKASSEQLNVTNFMSPLIQNNVSELISNSLAINGVLLKLEDYNHHHHQDNGSNYEGGFPNWVSRNERKLIVSTSLSSRVNLVVAKDGSGNFKTIQAAINLAASRNTTGRFIIHVKKGVYRENIKVGYNVNDIMLVGDGARYTIVTGSRSVRGGYTTFNSATAGIDGLRFIARGITFANTAGASNGQAVALRSSSDLSVFYLCSIEGYQDSLFVHSQRQFYKQCYIYGTIDFIFGNAAVVFQNCMILVRRPLQGQVNVITAQGRNDPNQNTGISIHNSRIMAAPDLKPVVKAFRTYLGRPWQGYSRTVVMRSYLDSLMHPMGWLAWERSNFALNTLYYGEYQNFGPGSSTKWRVRWRGYHLIKSASVASQFTVGSFISGGSWLPSTRVPFISGL